MDKIDHLIELLELLEWSVWTDEEQAAVDRVRLMARELKQGERV